MGTWGIAVFADDLAADVRDEWREAILDGRDAETTTQALETSFEIGDDLDDPASVVFWMALAAAQMETGRLLDSVRDRAVAIIDGGADLGRWREGNPSLTRQREKVLERLRAKLVGPQPKPKRIRRPRSYGALFDPGDVILLRNPQTGERGLVYVVDLYDARTPDPVIEILIWDGLEIPADGDLARLPAVRLVPGAGRGLDGKLRPLYYMINSWRGKEEAFGPHLGEVIAKGVERATLADWHRGALSVASPCYTDFNLSWLMLAQAIGNPSMRRAFDITLAELGP